jgi:hypothetical protein
VSVDIHDQHRIGDTHTISKLQDAFSSSKISTVQNDSKSPKAFHNNDQKSPENISSAAHSDSEPSKKLPSNISANSKRKTSCLDITNHRRITSNSSTCEHLLCEHNEEEKEMVLKDTQEKYRAILNDTNMLDSLDILRSESSPNTLLHKVLESDIIVGTPRRLDCSAVVSQGVVQFLNDEQWMKTLKKTAIVLRQQVKPLVIV